MNCDDINQAIVEGSPSPLQLEADEHLRTCARCRELVGALKLPAPADVPSPMVLREIERGLIANLRPVRPIPPKRYIFVSMMAIFIATAVLGLSRFGAFAIAAMTPLQTGAIFGALTIGSGLLACSLVNQMVPGSRYRVPPGGMPLMVMILLMVSVAVLFQFQYERSFWFGAWVCIRGGTPVAAFAAVPLRLVLRRGEILSPIMTGAATGLTRVSGRHHRSGDSLPEPGRVAHPGIAPRRRGDRRRRRSSCGVGSGKPETDTSTVTFPAGFANILLWQVQN